jgi:putative transport protein
MLALLEQNPILLLFVVAAIGYLIGQFKLGGFSLGVSAVLFTGLAFGSLTPEMKLPEVIYQFGLVVFVYTIGLSSGPGFFAALRSRGLRDNAFVLGMIVLGGGLAVVAHILLGLKNTLTAGLFAGAFTNTPALAGVLETLKLGGALERTLAEPVVGYSVAYPVGVIGMLVAIYAMKRVWRVSALETPGVSEGVAHEDVIVRSADFTGVPIIEAVRSKGWPVILGRYARAGSVGGSVGLVAPDTRLEVGDTVALIGAPSVVHQAVQEIGERVTDRLDLDRHALDFRRIAVSSHRVAGQKLRTLELPQRFGALVTRVRRGEAEFMPTADTILELGDRVRVIAPPDRMREVSRFLGDSDKALSEIDVMTFGLGIALGLLLGSISIPLSGGPAIGTGTIGSSFKLGLAGGPLIVGLILGALGRTGPVLWQLPHSANLTLRQLGTILFLAGVGTRSGYAFSSTFAGGGGLVLFAAGTVMTCSVAFLTLWIGHRVLRVPFGTLTGMLAGLQTQPAVLAFATEQSKGDAPNVGYATVYPLAMIAKIVIAQVLLTVLK